MKQITKLLLISHLLLLGGCTWIDFWNSGDEIRPADLTDFDEEVDLRRVWSVNVGNGQGKRFNRLSPAYMDGRIFAASNNGVVMALDAESGDRLWRRNTDHVITGGVGAANGMVLVGTVDSNVVALDADDGSVLWTTEVSSEVLAAPVTNGSVVVVQTVDGAITALDADSGLQRWIYENTVPDLTLRGTSVPMIVDNFVITALANGTLISLALDNGTLRWEERVAIPTGRSDIDRMVDIDGELQMNEAGLIMAPSYQGYFATIDPVTGQTRWRTQESAYVGGGAGFGNMYIVDDQDTVKAYRPAQSGQNPLVWENEQLARRELSPPLGFSNYVAVGDFEGYVHLLSQVDGHFTGRARVDRKGVRARMLNLGNTLYVYGNSGDLVALRIQ